MVDVDVDAFLRQGYWPNSRARSPDSRVLTSSTTSSQSSYVNVTSSRLPRNVSRLRNYPPPPSVEDEDDSLAKEYGSPIPASPGEEPIHRGDPEQYPILLPVHEFNPERRFVLVSTSSDSSDDHSHGAKRLPRRPKSREPNPDPEPEPELTSYEANTGRKYDARAHHEEESEKKRDAQPNHEKRRSKLDHLPTIVTDIKSEPRSPDEVRRPKSAARSDKGGDDYFSPRLSSRLQEGNTLSPDVIEHASRGRDRAYYQGGSTTHTHHRNRSSHSNIQYEKQSPRDERRYKEKPIQSAKSTSPNHHKRRSTADSPPHARASSKVDYEKPRQYAEPRSPRPDRNSYARSEIVSNSTEKRKSNPIHGEYYYSSDDEVPHEVHSHRRQESLGSDTKPFLQPAPELRSSDKRRSRRSSPIPSPRTSQIYEQESQRDPPSSSPRSSTIPKEIRFSRGEQQRSKPPLSRTSTAKSLLNTSASVAIPAVVAAATAASMNSGPTPTDPRKSTTFPPPPPRTPPRTGPVPLGPRSSTSSLSSSPHRQPRPHIETSPLRSIISTTQPTTPYRRYLDDVQSGDLPDPHRCPRRTAAAGHVDWLTLPRCDNFHICPSCYDATFLNTEFAHHFVPAPFRAFDRPLVCDFGASRFFPIAFFLTSKYGSPDLALLFRNIANIAAKNLPCAGRREVVRSWFSVRDLRAGGTVDGFTVCFACAKTVEVLLPNLTGLFVPTEASGEPVRGVCALHQENERRFLFYFDLLEAAADKALLTKSTPDVQALADRVRESTEVPECARENPVRNGRWYVMRSMPHFTVCEECFGEVAWPMIQSDNGSLAATFHKNPQRMPLAACQLYSERMRSVFKAAVRHGDLGFLESKVRERRLREQEYHARIVGLDRNVLGAAWVEAEVERARREWLRWE
ncbi:uncharacterized protein GGS22DRAFT_200176 [Annulohypoxylon maeteangense]|uniref:uncharacterized protein n=1 Tax=Annulohypoxylon maeteangense TaxID=1927788 RepID=UPI0020079B55|nr:uncharacterized protein GGS22DRAFT_200176 [Annulohypoxylon maeteangense]KAI0885119.1 hypothetical protein GGS22DRAFT_200176 [Annulohypoxylon maeteangense]